MTTTLQAKGQVVIPKELRERKGLKKGTDFLVIEDAGSHDIILRPIGESSDNHLIKILQACPVKDFEIPRRSKQLPKKVEL